jgi:arylsulfatase A-like enzyme
MVRRRAHAAWGALVLALVAATGSAGCARTAPEPHGVLLISIDTLRADRLGAYGHARPTSPAIDAWAREGLLFESVAAAAPSTLLSHASLFTATIPQRHGASHVRRLQPDRELATLAELLRAEGYRTAAFHDGAQLAPEFGLDRGFDLYRETLHPGGERRFEATVDEALRWIDAHGARPFFLFLHTYEVHHPYRPTAEAWAAVAPAGLPRTTVEIAELEAINARRVALTAERNEAIQIAYDAGIRSVDRAFGRLRAGLERRGLWNRTLVALTSDHGEEFGEHGFTGWHSHTLYEELLRVPWIVGGPSVPRGRRADPVRSIDIAPTLLELAGIAAPPSFEGLSRLRPAPRTDAFSSVALGETEPRRFAAIRIGRHKLADGRLFDLVADPGETIDLAARDPGLHRALTRRLASLDRARSGPAVELDRPTREQLRALGYLSGAQP